MSSIKINTLAHFRIAAGSFYFIQGVIFSTWTSRISDVKNTLALSDGALGTALLAMPAGQICAMALSGFLVGHFGSCRMVRLAAVLFPALLLPLGVMGSLQTLIPMLFLFGMASNLLNIAVSTQCVGVERLYGKSIMVSFHGLWSLGGLTGVLLSIGMAALNISLFWNFFAAFFLSQLIYSVNCMRLMPRDYKDSSKAEDPQTKKFVLDPYILLLGVIGFGCLSCEGAMYNWCTVYFDSVVQPGADYVRIGYVGYMLAITCCRFSADLFVRKWGAFRMIQIAGILILGGILLLTGWPGLIVSTAGCFVIGFGTAAMLPICYSLGGKSKKVSPPAAITTISSVAFLGFLIAPPAVGFMAELLNLRWAMALVGIFAFATTLLVCRLSNKT